MFVNEIRANYVTNCFGEEQPTVAPKEDFKMAEVRGIDFTKKGYSPEDARILDAIPVFGKRVDKKPYLAAANDTVLKLEISPRADEPILAATLIERNGGKMQNREVNGTKQKIAIIKSGNEEFKYAVNEDGTLGERLITLSTFGKDKYITQSEHDKRMHTIFPNGVPKGVDVHYAKNSIGDWQPVFERDGKQISSKELRELYAEQNSKKPKENNEVYFNA